MNFQENRNKSRTVAEIKITGIIKVKSFLGKLTNFKRGKTVTNNPTTNINEGRIRLRLEIGFKPNTHKVIKTADINPHGIKIFLPSKFFKKASMPKAANTERERSLIKRSLVG